VIEALLIGLIFGLLITRPDIHLSYELAKMRNWCDEKGCHKKPWTIYTSCYFHLMAKDEDRKKRVGAP
jgi:hypothetical protein